MDRLRQKSGFICDMDGVIYHGNRILPGVREFVDWLQKENKHFLFLTNSNHSTPRELQQKLSCSAVIHMDPVITDDPEINELRHKVTDIVYRLDEQLTLHDFRIIRGPTHTNVIFDVVVPFHFKMTDAQLRSWLDERIKQIDPSYFCVINIDKN